MRKLPTLLIIFVVLGCFYVGSAQAAQVIIGNIPGTGQDYPPLNATEKYCWHQMIYPQSKISTAGPISAIGFYRSVADNDNISGITVWLGHTNTVEYGNRFDWINTSSQTQVFTGDLNISGSAGWHDIILQTPFNYNNTQNLVVTIQQSDPANEAASSQYIYTNPKTYDPVTNFRFLSGCQAVAGPLPPPDFWAGSNNNRPNIRLTFGPPASANNVTGFAWSENIGWISFNNASGGGTTSYGVNIDLATGVFSGYAWSENIGWINFAPAGPYPASPNYAACLDLPGSGQACDGIGNYNIGGWARALAYGGGWDGWIKLRGTNYGVSMDGSGKLSGWAWSDMVTGWISFSGTNYGVTTEPPTSPNNPPGGPGIPPEYLPDGVSWNRCSFKGISIPTFHWTYSDPDGDLQSAYEIEVDENASFNAPKFNHKVSVAATTTSYVLNLYDDDENPDNLPSSMQDYQLDWNATYFWRARVWDSLGATSTWSDPHQFKTDKHASPWADFTWTPAEPTQGEVVRFDPDDSETFGGTTISSYLWAITQGAGNYVDSTSASSHYPKIIFSTLDNKVRLQITDSDGYVCGTAADGGGEKEVTVQLPLPEYEEVPPIIWFKKLMGGLIAFLDRF